MLAVMTASGALEPAHPALEHGAVVLTTRAGAERCHRQLPGAVEVIALGGDAAVEPVEAVAALRERGYRSICSEAAPTSSAPCSQPGSWTSST